MKVSLKKSLLLLPVVDHGEEWSARKHDRGGGQPDVSGLSENTGLDELHLDGVVHTSAGEYLTLRTFAI